MLKRLFQMCSLYLYPGLGVYYGCYMVYATGHLLSDQEHCLAVPLMTQWDEKVPLVWRPLDHPDIEKGQWSPRHIVLLLGQQHGYVTSCP